MGLCAVHPDVERKGGSSMENLFTEMDNAAKMAAAPLAVRMRPRTLDELAGQQHAVGPGSWLFAAIASDALSSVILFGPAGTGKTSIAHIIMLMFCLQALHLHNSHAIWQLPY